MNIIILFAYTKIHLTSLKLKKKLSHTICHAYEPCQNNTYIYLPLFIYQ